MKTSELIGPALAYAAGIAEGFTPYAAASLVIMESYNPNTNWSQGGPIIEREGINTFKYNKLDEREPDKWGAHKVVPRKAMDNVEYSAALCLDGPTTLIAAMRAFVASRLGDEVEIPSELQS